MIKAQEPISDTLLGNGLFLVFSNLNKSLLTSTKIKMQINVAPGLNTEANKVIYPKVITISR
jgi:hypothetical protein